MHGENNAYEGIRGVRKDYKYLTPYGVTPNMIHSMPGPPYEIQ